MFKRILLIALLYQVFPAGYCQSLDSLSALFKKIQKGENDSVRFESNRKFKDAFEKHLLGQGSFERNFDSLKNISVQTSDDHRCRIYTWVVPKFDGSDYVYFGFVQIHAGTEYRLFELKDSTGSIEKPESEKLSPSKWLGAVYYDIVTVKRRGRIYYTLLGWKGKNETETQKVIEILLIDDQKVKFGLPVIKTGSVYKSRMIFTYNSMATMTLRYEKKYDGIVFDHFSVNKNYPGSLPGPDGTYDILKIKKGKWMLVRDVKVEN